MATHSMMRLAAVVVAVSTAGGLAGCGGARVGAGSWEDACSTTAGVVACAPQQRPPAGTVTGELLDGARYDLATDRGKVVVINFWGSWCAPCRAEADDLEQTYQSTKARGVVFVGVNSRDARDAAKAFEQGTVTYPSLFDPDGKVALAFDVTQVGTPSTLVLDRQGRIAAAMRRATTVVELRPIVEGIAAEPISGTAGEAGSAPATETP